VKISPGEKGELGGKKIEEKIDECNVTEKELKNTE